jgi:hypothetical protein
MNDPDLESIGFSLLHSRTALFSLYTSHLSHFLHPYLDSVLYRLWFFVFHKSTPFPSSLTPCILHYFKDSCSFYDSAVRMTSFC